MHSATALFCLLPIVVSIETFTMGRFVGTEESPVTECTGEPTDTITRSVDDEGCTLIISSSDFDSQISGSEVSAGAPTAAPAADPADSPAQRVDCLALNQTSYTGRTCTKGEEDWDRSYKLTSLILLYYQLDSGACVISGYSALKVTESSWPGPFFCHNAGDEELSMFIEAAGSLGITGMSRGEEIGDFGGFDAYVSILEALWDSVTISDVTVTDSRRKLLAGTTSTITFTMKKQVDDGDAQGTFDSMVSTLTSAVNSGALAESIADAELGTFDDTSYSEPTSYSSTVGIATEGSDDDGLSSDAAKDAASSRLMVMMVIAVMSGMAAWL